MSGVINPITQFPIDSRVVFDDLVSRGILNVNGQQIRPITPEDLAWYYQNIFASTMVVTPTTTRSTMVTPPVYGTPITNLNWKATPTTPSILG
jgi:hypothetical protein